jgi:DNA-binding GntR family transcriptional regulator
MARETEIPRSVLADQVKDRLLQAILEGRYPPGSRIVETRVAREYGVSQAPVREALRGLEAIGVVEINAFRGARVRRPSTAQLMEAFAVRTELEKLGARLAVPRVSEADVAELEGYIGEMRRAAREGDSYAEATADAAFHGRVMEIAANATLQRVWRHLEPFSRTYITLVVPGVDRERIAGLHDPVLAALRRGDPVAAAEALDRHFEVAGTMFASLWTEVGGPDDAGPSAGPGAPDAHPDGRRRSGRETLEVGAS